MNCLSCNNQLGKGDKFCEKCGQPVDTKAQTTGTKRANPVRRIFIVSAIIFVLAGAGVGGKYLWSWYWDYQNDQATARAIEKQREDRKRLEEEKAERIAHPTAIVGDPIKSGNWEMLVFNTRYQQVVDTGSRYSFLSDTFEPSYSYPEGKYLVISLEVKNISKSDDNIFIGDESFKLVNESGAEYKAAVKVASSTTGAFGKYLIGQFNERLSLSPEFSDRAKLYYDIPKGDHQYRLVFQNNSAVDLGHYRGIGIQRENRENVDRREIKFIEKDSPAEKMGLRLNDKIIKINGREFNAENLGFEYDGYWKLPGKIGENIELEIKRGDETLTIQVPIGSINESMRVFTSAEVDANEDGKIIKQ